MSCGKVESKDCEITDQSIFELPSDFLSTNDASTDSKSSSEEVPELLHIVPKKNRTETISSTNKTTDLEKFELNSKLIHLLKTIQEEDYENTNINYDKEQLKQLLAILENSEHELVDKNLMEFVNFVNVHNSENLVLDLSKMKDFLTNFQKDQKLLQKHRQFGLGSLNNPLKFEMLDHPANNEDIEHDLENLEKQYNLPNNYGLEGSRLGMGHYKGSHIGMGMTQNNLINKLNKDEIHGKGQYHLGQRQVVGSDVGHLERGPHGSLSFVPDKIKLDLDPDMVKSNHEGVVISYENEPKN